MYPGVASRYVPPFTLAEHDVVLASYEVLSRELYHVTSLNFHRGGGERILNPVEIHFNITFSAATTSSLNYAFL